MAGLVAATAVGACAQREVIPLEGEDPEVYALLDARPPDDPASSPLAAARRLHQSLIQNDTDMVWELLASPTRRALDERGAVIAASGRELLDASTLPGPGGSVRTVRYETIFFGRDVVDLRDTKRDSGEPGARRRAILAVTDDGASRELIFVQEDGGWKLLVERI